MKSSNEYLLWNFAKKIPSPFTADTEQNNAFSWQLQFLFFEHFLIYLETQMEKLRLLMQSWIWRTKTTRRPRRSRGWRTRRVLPPCRPSASPTSTWSPSRCWGRTRTSGSSSTGTARWPDRLLLCSLEFLTLELSSRFLKRYGESWWSFITVKTVRRNNVPIL